MLQLTQAELTEAIKELLDAGLITCTRGVPGDYGSTYALAWLPLDNQENFGPEILAQHAKNFRKFSN